MGERRKAVLKSLGCYECNLFFKALFSAIFSTEFHIIGLYQKGNSRKR